MALIRKIVVIGPESTGKSTLSEDLAHSLQTTWTPEFARDYLTNLGRSYNENDLLTIAQGQLQSENDQFAKAISYLICDTDLYVIKVWSEASFGQCQAPILEMIADSSCDLYLLTDIDVPWTDDPLREHPKPDDRHYFYHQYRDIVQNSGVPWVNVHGDHQQRLEISLEAIHKLID